jgi:hypothetical protein
VDVLQSRVLLRRRDFDGAVAFHEGQLGLVRYRDRGEAGRRGVVYFLAGGLLEITEAACGDDDRDATPAAVSLAGA